MKATDLVLDKLKKEFEHNGNILLDHEGTSTWVMAAAIATQPHGENRLVAVRVVLRTADISGANPFVDGMDIYLCMDEKRKIVEFAREDLWAEGPPIFHGGTVPAALAWVREFAEPFYLQIKDPFLTPEQRIALNGHDEDYKVSEEQEKSSDPSTFNPDDFDKWH